MSPKKPKAAAVPPLSRKQTAIIALYAQDIPTKQIIAQLRTTRGTLKSHKQTIFRKLAVHTTAGAVAKFIHLQRQAA